MTRTILTLTLCCLPLGAMADATLIYRDTSGNEAIRIFIKNQQLRMDQENESSVIYDTAASTMTVVQHKERQYFKFDRESINRLGSQVSAAQAELQAQLEQLPPEQRAMMENMMGGLKKSLESNLSQTEIVDTGKTSKINGISCKEMTYTIGGAGRYELCLADPADVGISQTDYLAKRKAYAFASEFVRKIASNVGLDTSIDFSRMEGMAIRVVEQGKSPMTLDEVLDSVPDDAFAIPKGYQESSMEF